MSETTNTGTKAPDSSSAAAPGTKPPEGAHLDRLQSDIDEVKRNVSTLLERMGSEGHNEGRHPVNALHDGAAALEAASESALATLTSRAWIDSSTKWVRETPLVSVIGSVLFGWTLASVLRR